MAFQLSPGVQVTETDLTSVVPAVGTSIGGTAGNFSWGPIDEIVDIRTENELVNRFGKPGLDYETFFATSSFLSYTGLCKVIRAADTAARNASVSGTVVLIKNEDDYTENYASGNSDAQGLWSAKYAGTLANGIVVGMTDGTDAVYELAGTWTTKTGGTLTGTWTSTTSSTAFTANSDGAATTELWVGATINDANGNLIGVVATITDDDTVVLAANAAVAVTSATNVVYAPGMTGTTGAATTELYANAKVYDSATLIGTISSVTDDNNVVLTAAPATPLAAATATRRWEYLDQFDYTPGTTAWATNAGVTDDEVHIIVVDGTGGITGVTGTILEKFQGVSKASDAKNSFGESNYYRSVVNDTSEWLWWMDHPSSAEETNKAPWAANTTITNTTYSTKAYTTTLIPSEIRGTLSGGVVSAASAGDISAALNLFANDELVDVNLIFVGDLPVSNASDVIDNVADIRKDCLVFLSPDKDSVVGQTSGQKDNILADITGAGLTRSSYAVMDSGWKYMYDRYYDRYVWVPCNGDTAGLCARTDTEADPWFSPAGYNRGRLKNVVRMAYSPNKTDRDALYKAGVNPIVGFPGSGIVLFGDKTLLEKPSAFDRINVRRLFIVLEKAIATASKFQLFEFNDEFSRAQFKNLVEPFLRDVQGRRGLYNFRVICDATNNTQQVIDSNSFVADIYIQPARSINFIQLNFVATRTGIQFEEVGA